MYRLKTARDDIYGIIEVLRKEKERLGISYSKIADELGVSLLTVAMWMEHKTIPSTDNFFMLCDYFGHKLELK